MVKHTFNMNKNLNPIGDQKAISDGIDQGFAALRMLYGAREKQAKARDQSRTPLQTGALSPLLSSGPQATTARASSILCGSVRPTWTAAASPMGLARYSATRNSGTVG